MITDRYLEETDLDLLELSLASDEYHSETKPEFFTQPGTATKVYEDEKGLICFVKGSPVLRLDIQWLNNSDRRNARVMMECFPDLAARAKENGFTEIVFTSNVELLRKFCIKRLGFIESGDELRKVL
jgi:hypothetical protein